jgi:DNA-binding transcriptional ArsR family regulator
MAICSIIETCVPLAVGANSPVTREDVTSALTVLSNSTRRAVLLRLAEGPSGISELAQTHDMTLAGMLKHVRVLEDAGMVRSLKRGRQRLCVMEPESCDVVEDWLEAARTKWNRRFDSMERYLDESEASD